MLNDLIRKNDNKFNKFKQKLNNQIKHSIN